jgi:riboflavin transporter FmnP
MNTKEITLIAVFAALTVALNPAFTKMAVAAPFAPFLFYQIWEIPIVAAFLLSGPRAGVSISIVNTAVLLAVFPGASPTGPFYNLAASLSMLLGIYMAYKLSASTQKTENSAFQYGTKMIAFSTILGIILRVGIMSIVNYVFLRYPPPIGYSYPEGAIVASLPLIGFFNATLALYTIPIGLLIAKVVSSNLKLHNQGLKR